MRAPVRLLPPLRTVGSCDPCARGYEPTPGTYVHTTPPVSHRLAA
ncbi:hypothetical protein ABT013_33910 [Streptomyces bacillaris]